MYTVNVDTANGTITANPNKGPYGTRIEVYVDAAQGYKYVSKSLKIKDGDAIDTGGDQPYFLTLTKNVTLTATFEQLGQGQHSVTIGNTPHGKITADPAYGKQGDTITLTVSPDKGYVLKDGSLKYTPETGSAVVITENTFTMPNSHITVTAEFEAGNLDKFLDAGIKALEAGNYDTAINSFEAAYDLNKTDQTAILYSTLGKLAAIAVDTKVNELMTNRLGITGYPGKINTLINPNWMQVYTDEELVRYYRDGNYLVNWFDEDSWFFSHFGLPPKAGYYKSVSLEKTRLILGEKTKKWGRLDQYYSNDLNQWVHWHDYNPNTGGRGQTGYYYWDSQTQKYIFVTSTPKEDYLDNYRDSITARQYTWWSNDPGSNFTGYDGEGYYWTQDHTYELVSSTPRYEYNTSRLPGMNVPSWFGNTDAYKDTFTTTNLKSSSTFTILLFANLIDKNTKGLNTLLDDLLSAAFGADFEAAYNRAQTLTANVKLKQSTLEAFGIEDIFEGEEVSIGKAEINVLFAALRIVKASLEWVSAYNWDTDVNFLRKGELWDDWTKLSANKPANIPFRNNFLKDRGNGNMAKSKADFIKAIDDSIAAYDVLIGDSYKLPQAYKDILNDYKWARDGFNKLKAAINGNSKFYVKEDSGSTYNNTAAGALFGIDMGKFFTPGQLSLDKLIETADGKGGKAPVFYGFDREANGLVKIQSADQIRNYSLLEVKLNAATLTEVLLGIDIPADYSIGLFPPEIGESVYGWYY